ncbi:hypothetical protein K7X08_016149 [Anisodus acutangulus]|uniref:Uncharacterized protein n=1 Tax=Anisodus acutangulus TaxID=402998 RepID=A0A9Q1QZS1_9SOLA|nr:hypothetical protein K7X08_016149 [Anisodus acutangulus]
MSLRRLRVVRDRLITRLLWNRLITGDEESREFLANQFLTISQFVFFSLKKCSIFTNDTLDCFLIDGTRIHVLGLNPTLPTCCLIPDLLDKK